MPGEIGDVDDDFGRRLVAKGYAEKVDTLGRRLGVKLPASKPEPASVPAAKVPVASENKSVAKDITSSSSSPASSNDASSEGTFTLD